MAAILRDSVVVIIVVVRTHPWAIPLAMITKRKWIHWFPLISHDALWATGALLLHPPNNRLTIQYNRQRRNTTECNTMPCINLSEYWTILERGRLNVLFWEAYVHVLSEYLLCFDQATLHMYNIITMTCFLLMYDIGKSSPIVTCGKLVALEPRVYRELVYKAYVALTSFLLVAP